MSFFAVLCALLIEQVHPLARHNPIHAMLRVWARWVRRSLDAGKSWHAWLAWSAATLVPALMALVVHWALVLTLGWWAAILWNVLVLYATLGFRQFSHHFTAIREALEAGDEIQARSLLAQWQQVDASELPRSEIVRHVIEYSVLAAHCHVFGVLACYFTGAALGLGPAGAVAFRMAEFVSRYWKYQSTRMPTPEMQPASEALQQTAAQAWYAMNWLPARMTALCFAIVGSFEDAIDCWRNYAQRMQQDNDGVILAATSGAINVRLGGEALKNATAAYVPDTDPQAAADVASTPGRPAETAHLRSVVGLVWRSVVLWLLLVGVLSLAHLIG